MYILGISAYSHEASACLIKDGKLIALIEEERLNREKHTWKFPVNAIKECLRQGKIHMDEVNHITFFLSPSREITGNLAHVIRYFPQSLNLLKAPSGSDDLTFLKRISLMQNIGNTIAKNFRLKKAPPVYFCQHHLAHGASCFYPSPFKEAAVLTIDGRGESTTCLMAHAKDHHITKIKEVAVPHSLGHFYGALTHYLGFKMFFDEWKVMGMSAYGTDRYLNDFQKLLTLHEDGGFSLNFDYFRFHTHGASQWLSPHFYQRFGPPRSKDSAIEQRHYDLAFALQKTVERAGVHLAQSLYKKCGSKNLCMTGGVVLNCLMNKRIVEETSFENFFFQPIANDAGTSLGSALYYYHHVLQHNQRDLFNSAYLGPEFSNQEIETVLKTAHVKYRQCADIAQATAVHIAQGKIVGWFQGRMEAGPRALGNRSIVADPTDKNIRDRMNARVKRREMFRPFAPSVLEERVHDFFIMPKKQLSPYMILIGDVRADKKELLPAITHHDGTARVHTVNKDTAPQYWQLIKAFEDIKGVPILLNTSFNENEPIVCTPQEALNCFLRTDFDVLAIGDFLVEK